MAFRLKSFKVSGIRSFDHESFGQHEIIFNDKSTIICGQNGSGKTTIVEALKLALTGDPPPSTNERLASFISQHILRDINGPQEAKIVLELTKNNEPIIIEWSLTLRGGKQMSCEIILEDGTVLKPNSKEVKSEISSILGLPWSVFANLIVVPQEETQWPFSTSNTLKELFDSFFNLEQANQQLDKLRETKKAIKQEIEKLQNDLPLKQQQQKEHKDKQEKLKLANKEILRLTNKQLELDQARIPMEKELSVYSNLKNRMENILEMYKTLSTLGVGPDEIDKVNETKIKVKKELLINQIKKLQLKIKENEDKKPNLQKLRENAKEELEDALMEVGANRIQTQASQEASQKLSALLESQNSQSSSSYMNSLEMKIEGLNLEISKIEKRKKEITDNKFSIAQKKMDSKNKEVNIIKEKKDVKEKLKELRERLEAEKQSEQKWSTVMDFVKEQVQAETDFTNQKRELGIQGNVHTEHTQIKMEIEQLQKQTASIAAKIETIQSFLQVLKRLNCNECSTPLVNAGNSEAINIEAEYYKQLQELSRQSGLVKHQLKENLRKFETLDKLRDTEIGLKTIEPLIVGLKPFLNSDDTETEAPSPKRARLSNENSQNSQEIQKLCNEIQIQQQLFTKLEQEEVANKNATATIISEFEKIEADYLEIDKDSQEISENNRREIEKIRITQNEFSQIESLSLQMSQSQSDNESKIQDLRQKISDWDDELSQLNKENSTHLIEIEKLKQYEKEVDRTIPHIKNLQNATSLLMTFQEEELIAKGFQSFNNLDNLIPYVNVLTQKIQENTSGRDASQINLAAETSKKKLIDAELNKPYILNAERNLLAIKRSITEKDILFNTKDGEERNLRRQLVDAHKRRLVEINEYLQDKWNILYHNDDISTIKLEADIRSETENRIEYDYRFGMIMSQNVAVRMRSRASCGEKSLAALIIRCALLEKFAPNCPLIVLDDPLTNLDQFVVDRFADHVSTILGSFQVILTTFNKSLVRKLKDRIEAPEIVVYEIFKEDGKSQIRLELDA